MCAPSRPPATTSAAGGGLWYVWFLWHFVVSTDLQLNYAFILWHEKCKDTSHQRLPSAACWTCTARYVCCKGENIKQHYTFWILSMFSIRWWWAWPGYMLVSWLSYYWSPIRLSMPRLSLSLSLRACHLFCTPCLATRLVTRELADYTNIIRSALTSFYAEEAGKSSIFCTIFSIVSSVECTHNMLWQPNSNYASILHTCSHYAHRPPHALWHVYKILIIGSVVVWMAAGNLFNRASLARLLSFWEWANSTVQWVLWFVTADTVASPIV